MTVWNAARALARQDGLIPIEDAPEHVNRAAAYIGADLVRLGLDQGVIGVGSRATYEATGNEITYYRKTIAFEVQGCDGCSASANADFIVAAVNYVRSLESKSVDGSSPLNSAALTEKEPSDV